MIALAVAKRAAQGADLELQIGFFDKGFWPGSGHQFRLPDNLARSLDQSGQDVEGAPAQPHRPLALEQEPLRRKQPEWAKRDHVFVHIGIRSRHLFLPDQT